MKNNGFIHSPSMGGSGGSTTPYQLIVRTGPWIGILLLLFIIGYLQTSRDHILIDETIDVQSRYNRAGKPASLIAAQVHLNLRPAVVQGIQNQYDNQNTTWTLVLDCREGWFGRFGNNIISMASIIAEANQKHMMFAVEGSHPILNTTLFAMPMDTSVAKPTIIRDATTAYFNSVGDTNQIIPMDKMIQHRLPRNAVVLPLEYRREYQLYIGQAMLNTKLDNETEAYACEDGIFKDFKARELALQADDVNEELKAQLKRPTLCKRFDIAALYHKMETTELRHLLSEYLIIHLRSGDTFQQGEKPSVHWSYKPPPLAYFKKAILQSGKKKVLLIAECDSEMFVARELCRWGEVPIEVHSGGLIGDIHLLRHAESLVLSQGTFAWSIGLVSLHLKNLYCFQHDFAPINCQFPDLASYHIYAANGYIREAWHGTMEQVQQMIDFPENQVIKVV